MQGNKATKNKKTALLLCIFTGFVHRFYTGKIVTAIFMLLLWISLVFVLIVTNINSFSIPTGPNGEPTVFAMFLSLLSFFGIAFVVWWITDLVSICNGKFRDKQDNLLKKN
jgi:predicted secreted protein